MHILGSVFLGWSLGANDAANVFGTAVASRLVRYRVAVALICVFVVLGAVLQGGPGIRKVGQLTKLDAVSALMVCVTAGLTVTIMTVLRLPVSATQALVGAAIGMGLRSAPEAVQWSSLLQMLACWVSTPIGAALVALALYPALGWALGALRLGLVGRSIVLRVGVVLAGAYGAYALGANNVGNVTGPFYGTAPFGENTLLLALIGSGSIALGAITYGRNVMTTVGSRLVELGAFPAFVATLAQAVTLHAYAFLHVPVSSSQAVVGAVLGIGLHKGVRTINGRTLKRILFGWIGTPLIAGAGAYAVAAVGGAIGWV